MRFKVHTLVKRSAAEIQAKKQPVTRKATDILGATSQKSLNFVQTPVRGKVSVQKAFAKASLDSEQALS